MKELDVRKPRMTVAERKRRQRQRMRDEGLAPVEVWIPLEHRTALRRIERLLRDGIVPDIPPAVQVNTNEEVMNFDLLREILNDHTSANGYGLAVTNLDGEDALEVVVEDRVEFPIIVWFDGEQLLAVTYLWDESQVRPDSRTEMLAALLELNVPLQLSSFGKIRDRYVLFGALAANSTLDHITTELEVLSDNTLEAIEIIAPYLTSDAEGG